jgi:alcohol dehydrogenase (cytochrome c)
MRKETEGSSVSTSRALRLCLAAAGAILLVLIAAVGLIPAVRWRATILFDKATGRTTDIEWSDLKWMLRPGSGMYLEPLVKNRNPFLTIENPRHSSSDVEAGKRLFVENCSSCHGDDGHGAAGGPSLYERVFRQGHGDWALYRTITNGVPGTAMPGWRLPRDDVWKLVAYLQRVFVEVRAAPKPSAPVVSVEPVAAADLRAAEDHPADWLTYSGSYSSQRHSRLRQIDRGNVRQLRLEWARQFSTSAARVETTPIVRGSAMFVTEPPNRVLALDARSGQILWTFAHELPSRLLLCCEAVNRGVAILGDKIFVTTLDARLIALDAGTGRPVWDVEVADSIKGYSITGAPLAVDDMIVTGVAGGEYGIRGFVDAYDAATGKRRWRFYTVPDGGEPGSDTWGGDPLRSGGGPTWLTGSFDPELRLIYWGVGNPSPNFNGENRKGDNLYTNSVIALEADSGKLRWYFQFTPHDLHDWDSVQIPVLVDAAVGATKRKLLAFANRNAFYYLLDRATGQFLLGTAFVKQTWADGLDEKGRPRTRPESIPSRQGAMVYPSLNGATNWWSPTYDPELGLMYVPTVNRGGIFYLWPDRPPEVAGAHLGGLDTKVPNEDMIIAVKALEVTTGHLRWEYSRQYSSPERKARSEMGGLMSTAGRLVFGGDGETLIAWDAETGTELWRFETGGSITATPAAYELGGREYVVVATGRTIMAFALPPSGR